MLTTTLEREWDAFDAYLFDIDGTLLHCTDAVHYFAFCSVLSDVVGRPISLDGVTTQGNVDVGILRDALTLAALEERTWRSRLPQMRQALSDYVLTHKDELNAAVLPGVREVLIHLRNKGAVLGIATGNLGPIGKAKLEHVGLWEFFTVYGWSDEFETREDVFRGAVANVRSVAGEQASICVLGDTPADVAAARANHLAVIAVATGIYLAEDFASSPPDLLLRNFEDLLPPPKQGC